MVYPRAYFQLHLGASLKHPRFLQADLWGGPGSAINQISANATAFPHRIAIYTFQFYASSASHQPPYPADGIPFVTGMVTSITNQMPTTEFGM